MSLIEIEENKSRRLNYTLWVEKYRPISIKTIISPASTKRSLNAFVKDQEIPNLLLFSNVPGTGKTSTAKALVNDIGADYLYINSSSDSGIDILRSRISKFASSVSFMDDNIGKKKIVILDEFDGTSLQLQSGLRAAIEEFHDTCRFILTANYITKIIQPLQSRCQLIDFNLTAAKTVEEVRPQIIKRLTGILKNEKCIFVPEIVERIVDQFYPDMRRMLNLLQQYSKQNGNVIDENIFSFGKVDAELYDLVLQKKITAARKFIIERSYDYSELYREFFDNFIPMLPSDKQGNSLLVLADYHKYANSVIDPEIHFTGMLLELMTII